MSEDLISVIIPVYNVEKYLRQCVDSILKQTYKNLEIILVDDESPDSAGIICDEYTNKYENIRVIHKKNAGLGMARNSGLEIANGDYVYFLDSDDYIAEDEIEKLYNAAKSYGVDAVIPGYTSVDDNGNVLKVRKLFTEIFPGEKAKSEMLPRIIGSAPDKKDSLEMGAAGSLYSMKVIRDNHIRFVSEREMKNEDMVFNVDFLRFANGSCAIDSVGQYYRNNPDSLSHKYQPDRFERDEIFYYKMKEKLISDGFDNFVIERLQRHFFIHILIAIKQINDPRGEMSFKEKISAIDQVCSAGIVKEVISEYPYQKLGIKQRIFILMVKYKLSLPLLIQVR